MARSFQVNGESLVSVKGRSDSGIASLSQLCLAEDPIVITPRFKHKDINVDAWGEAPVDVQWMLAEATITFTGIHMDRDVLDVCMALSMGGSQPAVGMMARAGTLMGGGVPRFSPGNNYISLNIYSPILNKPWLFYSTYLAEPPISIPLGTEKSVYRMNWRCVPYVIDPANIVGGIITGATNYPLWSNAGLDT